MRKAMNRDLPIAIDLVVRGLTYMRTRSLIALRADYREQPHYRNDAQALRVVNMISYLVSWRRLAK